MSYDIVIAGGGPAGLMAAKTIIDSTASLKVLLVEKSKNYKDVVKCGEGVWKQPFEKLVTPRPDWIRLEITKASFMAPNQTEVLFSDNGKVLGYILDRVLFQEEFLQEISESIEVRREIKVKSVENDGDIQNVTLSTGETIQTKAFIDASGPTSHLGEPYGVPHVNADLEPALYAIVKNVKQHTDRVVLQMSGKHSPGGYVWHFPVSEDVVNLGIVFGKGENKNADIRKNLENYIAEFFPEGEVVSWTGGAIPSFKEKKKMAAPGFVQCGDAASLVNPATRSGISESMYSGKCAAESALEMVKKGTNLKKIASAYEKRIHDDYTKSITKMAKMKKSLYAISDNDFNAAADKLVSIPEEKRTMLRILQTTVTKSPKLLLAMRHLL